MGKYNRITKSKKLQSLTSKLEVSVGSEELNNQVQEIAKAKNMKLVKPTAKPVQVGVVMNAPRTDIKTKLVIAKKDLKAGQLVTAKEVAEPQEAVVVKESKPKVEVVTAPKVVEPVTPEKEAEVITIGKTPEEISKLNIYQKLQIVRSKIADFDVKKSGQNSDKGFVYFELPDYLPMINKLNEQAWLMTKFDMTVDKGILKVFNAEKPEEVLEFELPTADLVMADAEGKQAEGIQIMGGKTTYMRRYLMQIAYEISVKDTVDNRGQASKKKDDLDQADIDKIQAANDIDTLGQVCKDIKARKGFDKQVALINHYTTQKEKLGI